MIEISKPAYTTGDIVVYQSALSDQVLMGEISSGRWTPEKGWSYDIAEFYCGDDGKLEKGWESIPERLILYKQ